MKKFTSGDVREVNNGTNGSLKELTDDARRRALDRAESMQLLKEIIIPRFVLRLLCDARKERVVNNNENRQEESPINKRKEEEEAGLNLCISAGTKRVRITEQAVEIPADGAAAQFHDGRDEEKRNNKKKKCFKLVKKPRGKILSRCSSRTISNRFITCRLRLEPPRDMPYKFKKYIEESGGSDIKLVIIKPIYKSDLDKHTNRLSIPLLQVRDDSFLTEEEREFIQVKDKKDKNKEVEDGDERKLTVVSDKNDKKKKDDKRPGLIVVLIDPSMKECEQHLKTWNMNSYSFVITSNWNPVVERHEQVLKEGTIVQVWSFRRRHQPTLSSVEQKPSLVPSNLLKPTNLGFALIIVNDEEGSSNDGESSNPSEDMMINTGSADTPMIHGGKD